MSEFDDNKTENGAITPADGPQSEIKPDTDPEGAVPQENPDGEFYRDSVLLNMAEDRENGPRDNDVESEPPADADPSSTAEPETVLNDESAESGPQQETAPESENAEEPIQPETEETPAPEKAAEKVAADKPAKKPLKVPLFTAVIAVLAVAVLTAQITFLTVRQSYHNKLATVETGGFGSSKLAEVDRLYRKYYVNELDDGKLIDGIISGYIYGANDKYGSYMSSEEFEAYTDSLNAKTEGIGASVIWNSDMSAIEVINVYENSPAEKAGVLIGDLIVEVDGTAVSELGFDAGVGAVKGEAGTKVTITVKRGKDYSETLQIEAVRDQLTVKTVSYKPYGEVAVISISNFYSTTPSELKGAVSKATSDGCDRIVFDVRNNPGGYLTSVLDVLDYILPEGVIVRIKNASGEWTEYKSDESCLQMPMTVIVNERTASAAELFTSALKDYNYATVVGMQTYGKGTVLDPFILSDGSVVYISAELYYPPKSDNFEGVGVTPDVVIDLDEESKSINYYKLTYETDNQLRKAVEIIKEK